VSGFRANGQIPPGVPGWRRAVATVHKGPPDPTLPRRCPGTQQSGVNTSQKAGTRRRSAASRGSERCPPARIPGGPVFVPASPPPRTSCAPARASSTTASTNTAAPSTTSTSGANVVTLADGTALGYDVAIVATGARRVVPGRSRRACRQVGAGTADRSSAPASPRRGRGPPGCDPPPPSSWPVVPRPRIPNSGVARGLPAPRVSGFFMLPLGAQGGSLGPALCSVWTAQPSRPGSNGQPRPRHHRQAVAPPGLQPPRANRPAGAAIRHG
jgi:hypothetical protein